MTFKIAFAAVLVFAAAGCSHHIKQTQRASNPVPEWVYSPSGEDYVGGVGVCGSHIKGKTGQRELAVSRALDEIARQMGVDVSNILKVNSKTSGGSASMSSYSVQTVSGARVEAVIVDTWTDPVTGELYVYMQAR